MSNDFKTQAKISQLISTLSAIEAASLDVATLVRLHNEDVSKQNAAGGIANATALPGVGDELTQISELVWSVANKVGVAEELRIVRNYEEKAFNARKEVVQAWKTAVDALHGEEEEV